MTYIPTRRALLTTTGLVSAALLLQAGSCATITPAEIVTDATNLPTALLNGLNAVSSLIPASYSATVTTITNALTAAQTVANGLTQGLQATSGASLVQQIETDVNDVLAAAVTIPAIPAPFSTALAAASVVLPLLESFVNQYITTAGASIVAMSARSVLAGAVPMNLATAEATLAQMAKK